MKQVLLLLFILISFTTFSQRFRWAQGASNNGGNGMAYYRSATDKHGNVYVTGYFSGTANFGSGASSTIASAGLQDIFLAKYDTTGALLWLTTAGSTGYDVGYACAVDSADNCYLVGTFSGTCSFNNGKVMYSLGNTDAFLAKYNKNGLCQWVNRFGSSTAEYAYGVDCSPNGTVYVTGMFTGFCAFLSQTTPSLSNVCATASGSSYELFLAKYNSNGIVQWVRTAGAGNYAYGYDVSVDDSANAYIVGFYYGTLSFNNKAWQGCGAGTPSAPTIVIPVSASNSAYHGYVAKFSSSGDPQWAMNCPGGSSYGYAYSIGGDGFGNLFITGYYQGTGVFGPYTLTASTTGYGTFVAKINTNGSYEWARNIQNNTSTWAWGYDVTGNASGACFVTGYTYSMPNFTGSICSTPFYSYNNTWGYDAYGVKFKSNGDCAWSVRGTSQYNATNHWAYGYGISVNDFGSIYMTGYNSSNLRFYLNADTVHSYGNVSGYNYGTYLAHFEDDNFIIIDKTKLSLCPGDSFYLPYRAYGVYADSNTYKAMISDGNGGWQAYQYVGQKNGSQNDSIMMHIPFNLPNGLGYRFRVESSAPLVRSNKSLNDVAIVRPVADILNADDTLCLGDSLQLTCANAFKYKYYSNFYIKDSAISNPYISPPATTKIYLRTLNQAGCENFDSIKITILPRPMPFAGRDSSVCIGDSLQLQASGGNYYRWYPAIGLSDSTIANPKVLLNGDRTYHVIVGNGYCVEEDAINLTQRTPLKILNYADTTICKGQTAVLHVAPSGGYIPGYTLTWDNAIGNGNYIVVSPPNTTTYRVILSDGCTKIRDTAFITVNVRPKLTITPRLDTTICKGQSVNLYASGSGGNAPSYLYTWNNNAGTGKQVTVSPLVTTTYKILLRDFCTSQNDSALVTVFVRGDLVVNASADTDICIGQSATLHILNTAGGDISNYAYQWFNSANLLLSNNAILNVSPLVSSTYYVVVKDNCTSKADTDEVTVNVRQPLNVKAMADTIICKGTTVKMNVKSASGGFIPAYSYTWYDASFNSIGTGSQITSPVINSLSKYYIVLRDNCTSLNDTDAVVISTHPPLKVVARIDSIICIGQPVKLYAQASGGDSLHYNFKWMDSTTNALIGYGNYLSTTPSATTTYKVILSDNCTPKTDTDYVKIIHRPALVIIFPKDTTICRGNSVNLFVDGSGGDSTSYEFKWDNGLGSGKSTLVTPLISSTYKVVLKDFCTLKSDSAIIKVTVRDALKINAGADKIICYGQSTTLEPTVVSGGLTSGYSYRWYDITNNIALGTTKFINVSPVINTTYRVVFSDNCTVLNDSDEIKVNVHPTLQIKIITPSIRICRGEKVSLKSQGSGGYDASIFQYLWSNNLGSKSNITFFPDSTRYYKVTLTDGCSLPVSDSVLINVEQLPNPEFSVTDSVGCNPFTVQFADRSTNNTNCRYLWYFGDGMQDTSFSPSHTYTKTGNFTVELRLISPTGCTSSLIKSNFIINNMSPVARFNANPVKVKISNGMVYFTSKSLFTDSVQMQYGDGQQLDWTADKQWFHRYTDTGTYFVRLNVKNKFNCNASLMDTIYVEEDFNYFMPNIFSPNNDGKNDIIRPSITFVKRYEFKIYNRWGTLVYESTPLNCDAKQQCGWDGYFKSEQAPEDIYIYQMYILDKADKEHYDRGTFMLVR